VIPKRTARGAGPAIAITGRAAVLSGEPLYVRRLDGVWELGDERARERALDGVAHLQAAGDRDPWRRTEIYGVAA